MNGYVDRCEQMRGVGNGKKMDERLLKRKVEKKLMTERWNLSREVMNHL